MLFRSHCHPPSLPPQRNTTSAPSPIPFHSPRHSVRRRIVPTILFPPHHHSQAKIRRADVNLAQLHRDPALLASPLHPFLSPSSMVLHHSHVVVPDRHLSPERTPRNGPMIWIVTHLQVFQHHPPSQRKNSKLPNRRHSSPEFESAPMTRLLPT